MGLYGSVRRFLSHSDVYLSNCCFMFAFFSVCGPVFSRFLRTCCRFLFVQLVHQARGYKGPGGDDPSELVRLKKIENPH